MLNPDKDLVEVLKEICSNLSNQKVEYLIIGGTAVNFYGFQRISGGLSPDINFDIDIWYNPTTENFYRICKAIQAIGIENAERLESVIFDPKKTFLRLTHDRYRMEFLPHIQGFELREFNGCYSRKKVYDLDNVDIHVISFPDLKFNKQQMSRDVDLRDLIELEKIHGK